MSKTKIIKPSEYAMEMIMQIDLMPSTGDYDTVKSNPSSMDDPYENFLDNISYLLSLSAVLGMSFCIWW